MSKVKINYRHGDINFHQVEEAKGKTVENKEKSVVVGFGSTTGHKHVLTVKNLKNITVMKDDEGNKYFNLPEGGTLTHEEHKTIEMEPGIYKQFQEEEVDWFAKGVTRKVLD